LEASGTGFSYLKSPKSSQNGAREATKLASKSDPRAVSLPRRKGPATPVGSHQPGGPLQTNFGSKNGLQEPPENAQEPQEDLRKAVLSLTKAPRYVAERPPDDSYQTARRVAVVGALQKPWKRPADEGEVAPNGTDLDADFGPKAASMIELKSEFIWLN